MKIIKFILMLAVLFVANITNAKEIINSHMYQVNLMVDKKFSSQTGAPLMYSATELYNYLLPPETTNRYLKVLIDFPIAFGLGVTNHEFFGHGARSREFHIHASYHINFFKGSTHYEDNVSNLHSQKKITLNLGGIEANDVLANKIKTDWLTQRRVNYNQAWLGLFASMNQTWYVHLADYNKSGNDVAHYISKINQWYGKEILNRNKLKRYAVLDYLDPFLYYDFYTIYNYMQNGYTSFEYPMFKINKNTYYLPGMKLIFTPYGIESQLVNYISYKQKPIIVKLNYGKNNKQLSYGMTFESNKLFSLNDRADLGCKISFWRQPELFKDNALQANVKNGYLATLKLTYHVTKSLSALANLGYKTKGFVQGEPLSKTGIIRVGVSYSFFK